MNEFNTRFLFFFLTSLVTRYVKVIEEGGEGVFKLKKKVVRMWTIPFTVGNILLVLFLTFYFWYL